MARRPLFVSLTAPPLVLAASCAGAGVGSAPESLVTLYDLAAPDGVIEIELDRDGTIHEMEAEISVDALPDAVRRAALERAPGAQITGAEREVNAGGWAWEVKLAHQGAAWELIFDDEGTLLESEKELQRSDAPATVLDAAERALPGGTWESIELVERPDAAEYHVKKTRGGGRYKVVLAPNGTVKRVVREAAAEIEIPLATRPASP